MTNVYYISRNYTEFGPFEPEEIVAFHQRGVLRGADFIRKNHEDHWLPLAVWATAQGKKKTVEKKTAAKARTTKPSVEKMAANAKAHPSKKTIVTKTKKK